MEEEHVENDMEGLMYAALHYVDETQSDVSTNKTNVVPDFDNAPRSNLRRYWRNNENRNSPYSKINTVNKGDTHKETVNKNDFTDKTKTKSKDEKRNQAPISPDLSIFQQPVPDNFKKTIEIMENDDDNRIVELESSEDDEVVEVALPPKPTITIESSDEDEIQITSKSTIEIIDKIEAECIKSQAKKSRTDRDAATSPVPSVVSSVSDDFIRGDCIALNITSNKHNNESFDFSLHGSDLEQTPSKKRKKKKNREATSTPLITPASDKTVNSADTCFATPKSKAKNKRQRRKSYQVSDTISIPNADVYDSDSNHSIAESVKNQNQYIVSEKGLPNTDVYESDSNNSENVRDCHLKATNVLLSDVDSSENSALETTTEETPQKRNTNNNIVCLEVVDLSERSLNIDENIVMANVTGFSDPHTSQEKPSSRLPKCGSTKIPAILNEDLDFDNLKGNKVSKRRWYSLTTLRAEMEKFYNESWGGEDFNHREIQKNMSRDKSLWAIDPKDRMQVLAKRKPTSCNYCNRVGHRDDACRLKPAVCHMCGFSGHFETRCPKKICLNCGASTHIFTTMCRNCSNWNAVRCAECGHHGHPSSHCPDVWRRYHNATDLESALEENRQMKKHYQLFCSGCTRRGHLVHTCRLSLPFSGLQINSPYVKIYRPVYAPMTENCRNDINQQYRQAKIKFGQQDLAVSATSTPKTDRNKRQSKSPCASEVAAKKKYTAPPDSETKNYLNIQKKQTQKDQDSNKETTEIIKSNSKTLDGKNSQTETEPDLSAVPSNNHDKKGQVIQDNEVSDTSEVITSARIYITNEISEKLKSKEGEEWSKETAEKNNITIEKHESNHFFTIKGTVGNQEAFQTELRDWIKSNSGKEHKTYESDGNISQGDVNESMSMSDNIPKNKNNVLRKLSKALETLKQDLGDPNALYKEATYLQNKHQQLLKQKVISPKQLSNNKENINFILRKLNMVLLGQAGLANGSKHVSELIHLQEKVNSLRQKNIPLRLRQEIGEHFHSIFTAIPRDDYAQLIGKYYGSRPTQSLKKKSNNKYFKSPNSEKKNVPLQLNPTTAINNRGDKIVNTNVKSARLEKARKKLVLVHTRLSMARPVDSVLKKTKEQLIRELYHSIRILRDKSAMSPKLFKKVKKMEHQVQVFLTNL